jgi:hypothetical protein
LNKLPVFRTTPSVITNAGGKARLPQSAQFRAATHPGADGRHAFGREPNGSVDISTLPQN